MEDKYTELLTTVKTHYINKGLALPKSVSEYTNNFPKGFSRQVLKTRYSLTCAELLNKLNEEYVLKDPVVALLECCTRLNYTLLTELDDTYRSKSRVEVKCNQCGYVNNTTLDSLRGSTKGCVKCTSGNLAWHMREQELRDLLLDTFDAELVSSIPTNQTGYITIRHIDCGTEYTTQLLGIVSPNTKLRGTCPNCRSSDRRVTNKQGITFGSQFELDSYNILKHLQPEVHVEYKKYFSTNRRWVCDFKIGINWIEVSNFKQDFKGYFNNISEKERLVESNGHNFFFIRSLKELEEFASIF